MAAGKGRGAKGPRFKQGPTCGHGYVRGACWDESCAHGVKPRRGSVRRLRTAKKGTPDESV